MRLGLLVGLVACSGGSEKDGTALSEPVDRSISLSVDEDLPGVISVTAAGTWEGEATLRYGYDGDLSLESPGWTSGEAFALLGLKPGRSVSVALELDGEQGSEESVTTPTLPSDFPTMEIVVPTASDACSPGGYVLLSILQLTGKSTWTGIVDRDGDWVWLQRSPPNLQVSRARMSEDGRSVLWGYADPNRIDDVAGVVRMSLDGKERTETRILNGHHDFLELEEGQLAWLGYDFRDLPFDPPDDEPDAGEIVIPMAADTVHVGPEGASDTEDAETIYSTFDDFAPGIYWTGREMAEGFFLPDYYEFGHANSLMTLGGDFYVMFRYLDALLKIDGTSGEVLWQMGGPDNEFSGVEADMFDHAHMSEIWDGGMLVFDNADNTVGVSGVVEYELDEASKTYEKVWEYRDPNGKLELLLGDAVRMPVEGCDNVLASWTVQGRVTELSRAGEVVWEVKSTVPGNLASRVTFLESLYAEE